MKVRNLIIELREMNPEANVLWVGDNGEFCSIVTDEGLVLLKGKGGATWDEAMKEWPLEA